MTLTHVNRVQAQISELEHSHAQRLLKETARHHQELDLETDRLRDGQLQAEQALETREKAHRQRVRCLEEQVFLYFLYLTTGISVFIIFQAFL